MKAKTSRPPFLSLITFSPTRGRWFCRRSSEEDLPDVPEVVEIPKFPNQTDFNFTGGCFGTGPGQLAVSNLTGILELDSFVMLYQSQNIFTVEVIKDDGSGRSAKYVQAVTIVAGDPPELNIE